MYRNSNGNNGGRNVPNTRNSGQNSRPHPNGGSQIRVNNHSGNPNQNGKTGGAGPARTNGGRNGNSRRPC